MSARPTPDQPLLVNVRLTQEGDFYDPADLGIKQILIPAYQRSTLYEVNPIDDHLAEPNGRLTLELLPGTGYRVGIRSRTEEIHDSDLTEEEHKNYTPEIRVSGRNSGHEEGDDYQFKFSSGKSLASPVPITVEISQTGDFVAPEHLGTHQLTIPAAPSHAYLTIPTLDDRVDEPDGRVVVRVLPGDGYVAAGWHGQEHGGDDYGSALVKDNDIDGATDLLLDTPTSGSIADENDVDVFRLVITDSTYVVISNPHNFGSPPPYRFGQTFTVLDSVGEKLKDAGIVRIRMEPGTYYIEVSWNKDPIGMRREKNYDVVAKSIPDHSDTMANAHPIPVRLKAEQPLFLKDFHSPTDVDFFKIELEETTEVLIRTSTHLLHPWWGGMGAYNLEVMDSAGNTIGPKREGTYNFGRPYRLEAGTYYIRLSPYSLWGHYYGVSDSDLYVYIDVEYTEFIDGCSAISAAYDDPLYGCQWHLDNTSENPGTPGEDINVEAAWSTTQGAGVKRGHR